MLFNLIFRKELQGIKILARNCSFNHVRTQNVLKKFTKLYNILFLLRGIQVDALCLELA